VLDDERLYRFGGDHQLFHQLFDVTTSRFAEAKDIRFPHHIVFIDRTDATFFFPYHVVRFIEIPEGALAGIDVGAASGGSSGRSNGDAAEQGRDLPALRLPVPVPAAADDEPEGDLDLEIDEGLMQRIRDI
jgi:hypothetical protein